MQKKVIISKDTMILQISLTIYLVKSFKTINLIFLLIILQKTLSI